MKQYTRIAVVLGLLVVIAALAAVSGQSVFGVDLLSTSGPLRTGGYNLSIALLVVFGTSFLPFRIRSTVVQEEPEGSSPKQS